MKEDIKGADKFRDNPREPIQFDIIEMSDCFKTGMRIYRRDRQNGGGALAQEVVFKQVERGSIAPPCLMLERDELQDLCDELYRAGYKPKDLQYGSEMEKAQKEHIGDLRKDADAFRVLALRKFEVVAVPVDREHNPDPGLTPGFTREILLCGFRGKKPVDPES